MGFQFASKSKQGVQHKSSPSPRRTGISLTPPHPVLQLQRTIGNQGVLRLLESQKIRQQGPLADTHPAQGQRTDIRAILHGQRLQPKLTIGEPNDTYEQEADRVADQVMRMPASQARRPEEGDGSGSAGPATRDKASTNSSGGGGQLLPDAVRFRFEPRFGHDFSRVRVHADSRAAESAREIGARAYTIGRDIVFGARQYAPQSTVGIQLLAHELTHVVQQGTATRRVQRSCHDGKCASCAGGEKTLRVTFFFRRSANNKTMQTIRKDLTDSKKILKNCCINLKADFDWTFQKGGGTFDPGRTRATDPHKGKWDYPKEAEDLGASNVFDKAKGVPIMVVDDVPRTGGGVSVTKAFDPAYTGKTYMVFAANKTNTTCPAVAHELWHIGGGLAHDATKGQIVACSGHGVSAAYCTKVRSLT